MDGKAEARHCAPSLAHSPVPLVLCSLSWQIWNLYTGGRDVTQGLLSAVKTAMWPHLDARLYKPTATPPAVQHQHLDLDREVRGIEGRRRITFSHGCFLKEVMIKVVKVCGLRFCCLMIYVCMVVWAPQVLQRRVTDMLSQGSEHAVCVVALCGEEVNVRSSRRFDQVSHSVGAFGSPVDHTMRA